MKKCRQKKEKQRGEKQNCCQSSKNIPKGDVRRTLKGTYRFTSRAYQGSLSLEMLP